MPYVYALTRLRSQHILWYLLLALTVLISSYNSYKTGGSTGTEHVTDLLPMLIGVVCTLGISSLCTVGTLSYTRLRSTSIGSAFRKIFFGSLSASLLASTTLFIVAIATDTAILLILGKPLDLSGEFLAFLRFLIATLFFTIVATGLSLSFQTVAASTGAYILIGWVLPVISIMASVFKDGLGDTLNSITPAMAVATVTTSSKLQEFLTSCAILGIWAALILNFGFLILRKRFQ